MVPALREIIASAEVKMVKRGSNAFDIRVGALERIGQLTKAGPSKA